MFAKRVETSASLAQKGTHRFWEGYFTWSTFIVLLLWASINTGPWVWRHSPYGLAGWAHWLRAGFPFLVLALGIPRLLSPQTLISRGPLRFWFWYGLTGVLASVFSPYPWYAAYWGLSYLAVFASMTLFINRTPLEEAIKLNHLSWLVTVAMLTLLLFFARDVLFVERAYSLSGYGIFLRLQSVGDMAMSRASGMGRFAAIPAVVSYVLLWGGDFKIKLFALAVFVPSATLVWLMQSRGAIFGLGFAICFVTFFVGRRTRWLGLSGAVLFAFLLWTDLVPREFTAYIEAHITRGQSSAELLGMTGRDRVWLKAWEEINENPLIGQGFQADRYTIFEHAHNSYLYALMTSGYIGGGLFLGGLLWGWRLFWQIWRRRYGERLDQQIMFIQSGGVLAFFTVRSIPEVCGAMFGVDQMLMVPALAYIVALHHAGEQADSAAKRARSIAGNIGC